MKPLLKRAILLPLLTHGMLLSVLLFAGSAGAVSLKWPGHVDVGLSWVNRIKPVNNHYGSPALISNDGSGVLHAYAECGSYTAQLMLQSYEGVITADVLTALSGSPSPDAQQWYDAIDPAQPHPGSPANGIVLRTLDSKLATHGGRTLRSSSVTPLAVGDILAAKYNLGDSSGHVMVVYSITAPQSAQTMVLSGSKAIPGVTQVRRWTVQVLDSSDSVHGTFDTRYRKDGSEADGNDHGIGLGSIYLYENATPSASTYGQLVGWSWSLNSTWSYQFSNRAAVDNLGKTTYRPMLIGRFSGKGL